MLCKLFFCCLTCLTVFGTQSVSEAADKSAPTRILFLTQSQAFVHGSVKRPGEEAVQLAPAEVAMVQLGQQTGLFDCDCT